MVLYYTCSISLFLRLIQNSILVAFDWTSGIIAQDGLSTWKRELDVSDGGNIAGHGSFSFTLSNVDNKYQKFIDYGIVLDNCVIELWNWDGDQNAVIPVRKWVGRCQTPEVDNRSIKVNCIGLSSSRVDNLIKLVNTADYHYADTSLMGKPIPITFGKLFPSVDTNGNIIQQTIAEFIRSENNTTTLSNVDFTGTNPLVVEFPLTKLPATGHVIYEFETVMHANLAPKTFQRLFQQGLFV